MKPPVHTETANIRRRVYHDHPRYKWVALSNTTLGILLASINASIVLISLPAIFRGIGLDPLAPGNISYLLWMLMGYLVVTAVLVVHLRPARRHVRPGARSTTSASWSSPSPPSRCPFDPFHRDGGAIWLIGLAGASRASAARC